MGAKNKYFSSENHSPTKITLFQTRLRGGFTFVNSQRITGVISSGHDSEHTIQGIFYIDQDWFIHKYDVWISDHKSRIPKRVERRKSFVRAYRYSHHHFMTMFCCSCWLMVFEKQNRIPNEGRTIDSSGGQHPFCGGSQPVHWSPQHNAGSNVHLRNGMGSTQWTGRIWRCRWHLSHHFPRRLGFLSIRFHSLSTFSFCSRIERSLWLSLVALWCPYCQMQKPS